MIKYNREYFVPCVVKSKDYLVGFLDTFSNMSDMIVIDENILDSCRFTEYLPDGSKRSEHTNEEIKIIMKEYQESLNVKENENESSNERNYFQVSCSCGNFHSFNHSIEIPEESLICSICGKVLIDYTNNFDYMYDYVGKMEQIAVEFDEDSEEEDEE